MDEVSGLDDARASCLDHDRIHGRDPTSACQWSGSAVWSVSIDHWDPTDYPADDTLVVSDPEQLKALAGELRSRIVGLLRERAMSTQQLANELGLPKGTVGHHLKVLERAGLIRVVHTRQVRAVTEKFYGRVARLFLFQIDDPDHARAAGASTLRDAAAQLERAAEPGPWGMVFSRLTPEQRRRFGKRLARLLDDFAAADAAGGTPHRLVVAAWPVEKPYA